MNTAAHLPVWPFIVLAVLLAIGHRQSRSRLVRPATLALSLFGVIATFGAGAVPVLAWAVGFGATLAFAAPLLAPRGLTREAGAVRMPGSWVPMGLVLAIFMTKFGLGVAAGVQAQVLHQAWFIATACATLGLLSGAFAVRARAVRQFGQATVAA